MFYIYLRSRSEQRDTTGQSEDLLMPDDKYIRKIKSVRNAGIFRALDSNPDLPDFADKNLIYGFNGSGKSTLSRILASLGKSQVSDKLPAGCSFAVTLADGKDLHVSDEDSIADIVLVFNTDFISENLSWDDGKAKPVFYLGKEHSGALERIDKLKGEVPSLESQEKSSSSASNALAKAFNQFKTDKARIVATELQLGRKFNATNLENDCANWNSDDDPQLTDDEVAALKSLIHADAPLPKISKVDAPDSQLADLRKSTQPLIEGTYSTLAIEELNGHESMAAWVREGLHYHQGNELSNCLFCGNLIGKERLDELEKAFDDRFDELIRSIENKSQEVQSFRHALETYANQLPRPSEISADIRGEFEGILNSLKSFISSRLDAVKKIEHTLIDKQKIPQSITQFRPECIGLDESAESDGKFFEKVEKLDTLISIHNAHFDDFNSTQTAARDKLKRSLLASFAHEYERLKAEAGSAQEHHSEVTAELANRKIEIGKLEESLKQHAVAANTINAMIQGYLGHGELEFRALESGYEIRRNGEPFEGPLSEGEKTAIAICYFLTTLEAEGRQVKDLIIVLDDPISSLDTRALSYAVAMVKSYSLCSPTICTS